MKKHLIRNLFLLFSFLPFIETFANWNSFIINFDKNLYGKGQRGHLRKNGGQNAKCLHTHCFGIL